VLNLAAISTGANIESWPARDDKDPAFKMKKPISIDKGCESAEDGGTTATFAGFA
jgi:hypothetical protein